ncbi:MAG: hypothetical protein MHM6MM_005727, partial [Cercozoa sp. M6MM]
GGYLTNVQSRRTRAVDVFALGCVVFFALSGGRHPFDLEEEATQTTRKTTTKTTRKTTTRTPTSSQRRRIDSTQIDWNIRHDKFDLTPLSSPEARQLVRGMIQHRPEQRLTAREAAAHPLFWPAAKRLRFLQLCSDRLEQEAPNSRVLRLLESHAPDVVGTNWHERLDARILADSGKYRRYDTCSIRDALRLIRNKSHHFRDLPAQLRDELSPYPSAFVGYFDSVFPSLLSHLYAFFAALNLDDFHAPRHSRREASSLHKQQRHKRDRRRHNNNYSNNSNSNSNNNSNNNSSSSNSRVSQETDTSDRGRGTDSPTTPHDSETAGFLQLSRTSRLQLRLDVLKQRAWWPHSSACTTDS